MENQTRMSQERREFLRTASRTLAHMAIANTAIYVIGSMTKELDGDMVAGAKCTAGSKPFCMLPSKSFCCQGPMTPVDDFWTPCMMMTPC